MTNELERNEPVTLPTADLVLQLTLAHRPTMTQGKCFCDWQGDGMFGLSEHLIQTAVDAALVNGQPR